MTVFPVIDVDPLDPLAGPTFGGPFCRGFFTFAIDDSPILHVAVRDASSVSGVFVSRLRIWQKKMPNAICQFFFLEKTLPRMGSVAGLCGSVQRVALP